MKKRTRNATVAASLRLILLVLAMSLTVPVRPVTPQTNQECDDLKAQIKILQDALIGLSNEIQKLHERIDKLDQAIQQHDQYLRDHPIGVALYGRDKWNATHQKLIESRDDLKKHLEEDERTIQALKDIIADLLNKLGDCGNKTDDATKNFNCLQKQGAERDLTDPERAHNPKTGQNFVWDTDKKSWIDVKTGECVCPKCPATTTPPSSPKPSPTPTSNPPENKKVSLLPGYHVDSNTANGLYVTTFDTPQGKIKVNLPDDLAAGDTISGTVETEPAGKNDAERAQNQAELNGYVVELEGQKTKVGDKKITCNIPTTLTTEAKTIVLQHNGQTITITEIPILVTPPPTPNEITLPTGGQQGKPIEIKGPCDGIFAPNDYVKIGGTILPPIAKGPRKEVVNNTSEVVGPTKITRNEQGVVTECPFRNIGIKLSADKLNLQRGQTTTLHVTVIGLWGITQDLSLDLVNNSASVIKMSGGEVQHPVINPAAVQRDGTYSTDRTLTGVMAGAFGVTGTVRWSDVCKHPVTQ